MSAYMPTHRVPLAPKTAESCTTGSTVRPRTRRLPRDDAAPDLRRTSRQRAAPDAAPAGGISVDDDVDVTPPAVPNP